MDRRLTDTLRGSRMTYLGRKAVERATVSSDIVTQRIKCEERLNGCDRVRSTTTQKVNILKQCSIIHGPSTISSRTMPSFGTSAWTRTFKQFLLLYFVGLSSLIVSYLQQYKQGSGLTVKGQISTVNVAVILVIPGDISILLDQTSCSSKNV